MCRMRVIFKKVGEAPQIMTLEDPINQIWNLLGGEYHAIHILSDCCIVCRRENTDLPENTSVMNDCFRGNLIVTCYGDNGAEGIGTPEQAEDIARLLFGAVRDERGKLK